LIVTIAILVMTGPLFFIGTKIGRIRVASYATFVICPRSTDWAQAQVPEGAQGPGGPGAALPVYSNATAASKVFNPDIAVIGDFMGATGSNHVHPDPALQMLESEVAFQAIVDPYARADFFFSYGEVARLQHLSRSSRRLAR
jgi:hypothetical protein